MPIWNYEIASRRRPRAEGQAMFRRLFMRTTLGKRIAEAREAYRDLKITQYRSALRMKRAAVRAAVIAEVNRQQLRSLKESKAQLLELANLHTKRTRKGIADTPPPRVAPSKKNDGEKKFKEDVITQFSTLIPEKARNTATGHIMNEAVSHVVKDAKVDAGSGSMAAQLVASIAVDTNMNEKELTELVDAMQWESGEIKEGVKQNVLNELRKAKGKSQ